MLRCGGMVYESERDGWDDHGTSDMVLLESTEEDVRHELRDDSDWRVLNNWGAGNDPQALETNNNSATNDQMANTRAGGGDPGEPDHGAPNTVDVWNVAEDGKVSDADTDLAAAQAAQSAGGGDASAGDGGAAADEGAGDGWP